MDSNEEVPDWLVVNLANCGTVVAADATAAGAVGADSASDGGGNDDDAGGGCARILAKVADVMAAVVVSVRLILVIC